MRKYKSSPKLRDTNKFINDKTKDCTFQIGKYNPSFWKGNNNKYEKVNNCYAYACNIRTDGAFPHPGYGKEGKYPTNKDELITAIEFDGLVKIEDGMEIIKGTAEKPVWIVAVFEGYAGENYEWGYHLYRKVWVGKKRNIKKKWNKYGFFCFWAHKYYKNPVTYKDKFSHIIINPEIDAKEHNLNLVGYYLVKPEITICTDEIDQNPNYTNEIDKNPRNDLVKHMNKTYQSRANILMAVI